MKNPGPLQVEAGTESYLLFSVTIGQQNKFDNLLRFLRHAPGVTGLFVYVSLAEHGGRTGLRLVIPDWCRRNEWIACYISLFGAIRSGNCQSETGVDRCIIGHLYGIPVRGIPGLLLLRVGYSIRIYT